MITDKFREEISTFFDETYETDKAEIRLLADQYAENATAIIDAIIQIMKTHEDFIDMPAMEA
ncbi:hypothetical protein [Adlercreutzia sp. ZJ304]|uniref:hypothetical protein n=1 Tax=Adlercreutzia sp. ZJ304 TaxID=2709791 RepID=UPI0013EB7843|nr:hypothetical protein [Adlercreutzia sp. ZJ304]